MDTLPATTTPAHLTVDPWWKLVEVLAYGEVCDLVGPERCVSVSDDITVVLDPARETAVGFVVHDYDVLDVDAIDAPGVWDGLRFTVPVLGLTDASVGEVLLAVRARYGLDEATADALHVHRAMALGGERALPHWRAALEAGDMKAHFGLGATLCDLGRHHEAYGHLRFYTEVVDGNAWAWCRLGQACAGTGALGEARLAFERAIALDPGETDAEVHLARMAG